MAYLVELQGVQKLVQLPVLSDLVQFHVVLLETVQRKLGLVVHEDFQGLKDIQLTAHMDGPIVTDICHKLLACNPDILRQRCTEHHHLLVMRSRPENLLHVAAHVC